jgi:hypothetical protein
MSFTEKTKNAAGRERLGLGATCCTCNAELDLDEAKYTLVPSSGIAEARRLLVESHTACRECGANRRKLVVRLYGHQ